MEIDYNAYRNSLYCTSKYFLKLSLFTIILSIITIIGCLSSYESIKNATDIASICVRVIALCIFFSCTINCFLSAKIRLRYGIHLISKTPKNPLIANGKIEKIEKVKDIRNYFTDYHKRETNKNFLTSYLFNLNSYLLTIDGQEYYIIMENELKVGDIVEITYLPKSMVVLKVSIVNHE